MILIYKHFRFLINISLDLVINKLQYKILQQWNYDLIAY